MFQIVKLPKGNGKFRTIYVPDRETKQALRGMVSELGKRADLLCPVGVIHGFSPGRNPVTCATAHIGRQFTITMDLRDFFDSVRPELHLVKKIPREVIEKVIVDGAPRQGLPTSPAVANIAASDMDKAILKWFEREKLQVVYTRYADDLSFSYNEPEVTAKILAKVPDIVSRCGFKIAPEKTRVFPARGGNRIVTGVAVNESGVRATRAAKRRLRAALHQKNEPAALGLEEWCKVKLPNVLRAVPRRDREKELEEALILARGWNLRMSALQKVPHRAPDENLESDVIITGDPCMILGMSDFTPGWKSCMSHQHVGTYHRAVICWLHNSGTSLAYVKGKHTKSFFGVERPEMVARVLIHTVLMPDGTRVRWYHHNSYGDPQAVMSMHTVLKSHGIKSVEDLRQAQRHSTTPPGFEWLIEGSFPASWPVYGDGLGWTDRETRRGGKTRTVRSFRI